MSSLALDRPVFRTISLNVLLCAAVAAIPSLSHATALPLYRLEPMRLLLFVAILATNRRNALLMALWMPLFSLLTSGHPVFPKVLLIQGELVINTLIFFGIARGPNRFVMSAAVSVLASKGVYYAAKFVLIRNALLDGELFATPWVYQFVVLSLILLAAGLISHRRDTKRQSAS